MNMAMQKSSNIYLGRVVEKIVQVLGPAWYREKLAQLGLGLPTGVEFLSETWGYVPTPGKKMKNGSLEWFERDSSSTGYGL